MCRVRVGLGLFEHANAFEHGISSLNPELDRSRARWIPLLLPKSNHIFHIPDTTCLKMPSLPITWGWREGPVGSNGRQPPKQVVSGYGSSTVRMLPRSFGGGDGGTPHQAEALREMFMESCPCYVRSF